MLHASRAQKILNVFKFWRNFTLSAEETAKLRYTRLRWTRLPLEFKREAVKLFSEEASVFAPSKTNVLHKLRGEELAFFERAPYAWTWTKGRHASREKGWLRCRQGTIFIERMTTTVSRDERRELPWKPGDICCTRRKRNARRTGDRAYRSKAITSRKAESGGKRMCYRLRTLGMLVPIRATVRTRTPGHRRSLAFGVSLGLYSPVSLAL